MIRTNVRWLAVCLLLASALAFPFPVQGQEEWKAEFDDICAKTIDAMELKQDEIRTLIDRCDRLRPRIEKLEESQSKVYLKRLKMCRELFSFVLENPKGSESGARK